MAPGPAGDRSAAQSAPPAGRARPAAAPLDDAGPPAGPFPRAFEEPTEVPRRPKPHGPRWIVGLDLGVHYARVGYLEGGDLRLVPLQGSPYLPAWVASRSDGQLVVGARARAIARENPERAVSPLALLRALPQIDTGAVPLGLRLSREPSGRVVVGLGDRRFDVADVLGVFLRAVRTAYIDHLGHDHVRVMISVPPDLSDRSAAALRASCREAEIEAFRLEPEPQALLRTYHLPEHAVDAALTVDVGMSRLTVGLARRTPNGLELVGAQSSEAAGARAVDECIAELALEAFFEATNEDHRGDPEAKERTIRAVEMARPELRRSPHIDLKVNLPAPGGAGGVAVERTIRVPRARIEEASRDVVAFICREVQSLLRTHDQAPHELDAVIVAGSAGGFPPLLEALGHLVGREPLSSVPSSQAILLGLARSGAAIERREVAQAVGALCASIGIELPGGRFRPLVHAGAPLPVELRRAFPTVREHQTELDLQLFQGDGELVRRCSPLGRLRVEGMPRRPRGALTLELHLRVDAQGVLAAELLEPESGASGRLDVPTQQTPVERRRAISQMVPAVSRDKAPKRGLLRRLFGG